MTKKWLLQVVFGRWKGLIEWWCSDRMRMREGSFYSADDESPIAAAVAAAAVTSAVSESAHAVTAAAACCAYVWTMQVMMILPEWMMTVDRYDWESNSKTK